MTDFDISAMNLASTLKELERRGIKQVIVAGLSKEVKAACENPHSSRWHPSRVGLEVWMSIVRHGGEKLLGEVNYELTRETFGPMVGPLVKLGLTLSGRTPASVFSRLGQLASVALRNVQFDWKETPPSSGVLTLSYPCPVPREVVDPAWRGIFRVGSEMTGYHIRTERCEPLRDGTAYAFHVHW